ncbi:ATP-binding cassette domain-containing protein [Streptomyces sp. NPDC047860]|uniref:ABC transporter permease subunit n=1 Tax=Streptomyces sp. NPDC047860 TaxID=3155743 RepID=UPI0033C9F76D
MSSLTYDLTLAGLSVGAAAALTGIGLIVTYRATGVLNFAHGAIAMVCAYVLRALVVDAGWPLWWAAALTLLVVAPGIGVVLERFVFRPLSVRGGDPARTLVASIGVFVLLVGGAALVWGQGARDDAPVLVAAEPWGQLAVVAVLAVGAGAVIRRTRFGRELRAVVDNRQLAVLTGVDADRVAAAGWAFGSFTAGLTGVLLAPYVRLDPYGLPLLVMEVVAVAVAARMRSLTVAVTVALGIGVAQSQLTRLHPSGWGEPLLQAVGANLFVVSLLFAALLLPGVGTHDALPRAAVARVPDPPGAWIAAGALFLLPLGFAGDDLRTAVQVPALGVILLSLVVVTGHGGQISLGQAAYAGLGALFTALLAAGRFPGLPGLPELAALAVAVVLVAPLGVLTGWPAIGRRGLALALATFAVGVAVSRFVFDQPYATSGLSLGRPAAFDGDRAYYVLELVLLAAALATVVALRRGRTGRALAAMRDHEAGARAAGVRVPSLKLWAFVSGAALAALGGGLLGMGVRAFDPAAYDPVRGLLWFTAVVVLGADSALGALLGAALLVGLDAGTRGGVAAAVIGVLAVLMGRFPEGPYERLRGLTRSLRPTGAPHLTPLGARLRHRLRGPEPEPGPAPYPTGATATGPGPDRRPTLHPLSSGHRPPGPPPATTDPPNTDDAPEQRPTGPEHQDNGPGTTPAHHPHPADRPTDTGEAPEEGPGGREFVGRGGDAGDVSGGRGPRPNGAEGITGPPQAPGEDAGHATPDGTADATRREGTAGVSSDARPGGRGAWLAAGGVPPGGRGGFGVSGGGAAVSFVLEARGLYVRYGGFTALDGVDIGVPAGRVTAVVGPNGAGKSTLFHCLAGTVRPVRGAVLLGGRDVTRLPAQARTRLGIARTFQQLAVFPTLTVADNVRVGAEQARPGHPGVVERMLRLFGLDGPARALPAAGLPTGALRRVELARAVATAPRVLLLDEPAAGLDTAEIAALARILRALAADGTALLVVEHDLDLVADLADVVHVMTAGRIVASGPPGRVLDTLGEATGP